MSIVATQIKDMLIAKIESLSTVQKVYPDEKINPTGWPAVFVKAADMEGEFSSTAENSRLYAYNVLVLFPIGQDFVPESERARLDYAERVVSEVVDDIINVVDTDFELDGSPVLFTNAADSTWGEYEYEGGVAKANQITLRVYTEKVVV